MPKTKRTLKRSSTWYYKLHQERTKTISNVLNDTSNSNQPSLQPSDQE